MKSNYILAAVMGTLLASTSASALTIKPYFLNKNPLGTVPPAPDMAVDTVGRGVPIISAANPLTIQFQGISQYDVRSVNGGGSFIPPDTNGSVGLTQYMEVSNGAYAVYDKNTGAQLLLQSMTGWWTSRGQAGSNGDSRVMYNADAKRWIVMSFGASVANLNIAISNTDDALGGWQTLNFTGFAGGTADYPTLALDKTSVYIGTNNFAPSFKGTTLNVIPIDSLFNNSTPTVANMKQFVTAFPGTGVDKGFAQQGVNSSDGDGIGRVLAASIYAFDNVAFDVTGATSTSALGATVPAGDGTYLNMAAFVSAGAGRQPAALPANQRIISTLDERISSSVYEVGGRIYMVNTVNSGLDALDEARVRYTIIDSTTKAIIAQGDIGAAGYDYYQGAIAVNALGQVVITYNRSGNQTADNNGDGKPDGRISVMAQTFKTSALGDLVAVSGELLLKVSDTDDYHNGSREGFNAAGRQRWGDYAQVNVDPGTSHGFYLIGEFAREWNNAAGGHPTGTGGSSWGTWIAGMNVGSVPEPTSWAMMITGFGFIGGAMRRQRKSLATA